MSPARVTRVRNADRSPVERAFPGLKCKRLELGANTFSGYHLEYTVEGSIEALASNGLATREQLESLPPCGVRGHYRRVAGGMYQVRQWFMDSLQISAEDFANYRGRAGSQTAGQDEIARLGLPLPAMPSPAEDSADSSATPRPREDGSRSGFVGRLQRRIGWSNVGSVIHVNWDEVRRIATLARMQEQQS